MNSLSDLDILPVMDTSTHDLSTEFFTPLLSNSIRYERGVGFFSSGWLRINAKGMLAFANNGGRARWVTSPILDKADWEALETGYTARGDPVLRRALEHNITNLAKTLEKDTLSALAWMVADEIITFKLALPYQKLEQGDFHDKFGVFTDIQGNQVSFNGSYNDSIQGTRNYESIKIFCSWQTSFAPLVQADTERFEGLWSNLDPNVQVFDLPEAARQNILRLRTAERPYSEPDWIKLRRIREAQSTYNLSQPAIPQNTTLREYQNEAIDAWFKHQCRGLLEIATGCDVTRKARAIFAPS